MKPIDRSLSGFSLVEVLIGVGVLGVLSFAAASHLTTSYRHAELNRDKIFAFARAQSILEELRAFAQTEEIQNASELDQFDDGIGFSFTLTTMRRDLPNEDELVDPNHPISGNVNQNGRWRYARRITVRHFSGVDTRDLRIATVRIFLNEVGDVAPGRQIASASSVIRTIAEAHPSTQVYDVYLLAMENVPGWWVYMDTIQPFILGALSDLSARNPGLEFRTHWITKLAYGRNPQYTPFFNEENPSTDPIDHVYFYPSRMPNGSSALRYYVPDRVAARINVDGEVRNNYHETDNPWPYTLADQYNHAMRLPEEERLFVRRVQAGLEDKDTPTWRLLLEKMNSEPERFHNAIIVNLHGELLPMPPLRNTSDAARLPDIEPGVRVVTHPERLWFSRGAGPGSSDDVRLRVYSYKTDPASGPERLDVPVVIEIPGLDLTRNVNGAGTGTETLEIRRVTGGLDLNPVDGTRDGYVSPAGSGGLAPVAVGDAEYNPAFPGEMYARVRVMNPPGNPPETTVIELYGSPLISPEAGGGGLAATRRLYGLEYVPCSVENTNDFSVDLATTGTVEKNTARWILTIPAEELGDEDLRLDVVTRIGSGDGDRFTPDSATFSTGIMDPPDERNQPENRSETYAWWTASREAVPFTERYQFQGDPRHCPYADLKDGGTSFPNGYNWYFDDFETTGQNALSRWPGFDPDRIKNDGDIDNDGWEGKLEIDVPRLFQLLRGGLVSSEALWTTLTGWSYYYLGVGNEIGYDSANGFNNSIPVSGRPFGQTGSGVEQAITNAAASYGPGVKLIRSSASGDYWWGMPWLGELYPDEAYAAWWRVPRYEYSDTLPLPDVLPEPRGNLPAGAGAGKFKREPRSGITPRLPFGTLFEEALRRTQREGCTSFFNIGNSTNTFHHQGRSGTTGDLTSAGAEVAADFRFPLPSTTAVSRPFRLASDGGGGVGDEFSFSADYPRYSAVNRKTYFNHSSGAVGSALVELTRPGFDEAAFVVVSGIDRTTESGSAFIARYSVLSLIHGFLSAGEPDNRHPFPRFPRLIITGPTAVTELDNPATISIGWRTDWRRWDGLPYTKSDPVDFSSAESDLAYVLLYSADNGTSWRFIVNDAEATLGVLPSNVALRQSDVEEGGDEMFLWNTPAARFPRGSYRVRVECFRNGSRLHYSFHEEKIYINRS